MKSIALLVAVCAAICVSCGSSEPPTTGTPTTFDHVCDKANEGKRLSLEGYLGFPEEFKERDSDVVLRLRNDPKATENIVGVVTNFGAEKNQVDKPGKSFSDADLKVHTTDGKVVGYTDKVKVSGTLGFPTALATVEFKCRLDNPLIESSAP